MTRLQAKLIGAVLLFLLFHAGLALVVMFHAFSGVTLADSETSLLERFNIPDSDKWNYSTMVFLYVEYLIWMAASLGATSFFLRNQLSKKEAVYHGFVGAFISCLSLYFFSESAIENSGFVTTYHFALLFCSASFLFLVSRPGRTLFSRIALSILPLLFLGFIALSHVVYVYGGLLDVAEEILFDESNQADDIVLISNKISPKSYCSTSSKLSSFSSSCFNWKKSEAAPIRQKEALMAIESIMAKGNNGFFYWKTSSHQEGIFRSMPSHTLHYVAVDDDTAYYIVSKFELGTARSIYPIFFKMIYTSVAIFCSVWLLLVCIFSAVHSGLMTRGGKSI